jgi:hypothetical protein
MTAGELTQEVLSKLREEFFSSDKNRLALNVCSRLELSGGSKASSYPVHFQVGPP